jgi:hypothetical protein
MRKKLPDVVFADDTVTVDESLLASASGGRGPVFIPPIMGNGNDNTFTDGSLNGSGNRSNNNGSYATSTGSNNKNNTGDSNNQYNSGNTTDSDNEYH